MTKSSKPISAGQRLSRIEKSISGLSKLTKIIDHRTSVFETALATTLKTLTIHINNQANAVVSDISKMMDKRFTDFSGEIDKKLDTKLDQLREDINHDINESVMPLVYDHDERIDVLEKTAGIKQKN